MWPRPNQVVALQEAAIMWRLRHAHIMGLSGVAVHEGRGYLFMVSATASRQASGHDLFVLSLNRTRAM